MESGRGRCVTRASHGAGNRDAGQAFRMQNGDKIGDSGGQRGMVCGGDEKLVGLLAVGEEVEVQ
jgi:hypothetical protein